MRSSTSDRSDDNPESVRLKLFHKKSYPAVLYFGAKSHRLNSSRTPDEVFVDIRKVLDEVIKK